MQGRHRTPGVEYIAIMNATERHPRHDSATVIELPDASLLMIWIEMHKNDLEGNDEAPSSLASMRSYDGGRTWCDRRIEVAPEDGDQSVFNPSLLRLNNGEVLLSYVKYHVLISNEPLSASGYVVRSTDGGHIWGEPTRIWDHAPYSPANHTFTLLSTGRILKSVEEMVGPRGNYPQCYLRSGCFVSDDDGHTWTPPQSWVELPLRGAMENHIAECADGSLLMAVRTQLGSPFLARSYDGGMTWSKPQTSGLTSGESMPSLTRIPNSDDLLLVWNNAEFDFRHTHSGKRSPLACAVSNDNGTTWGSVKLLEDDPTCEFSNPACSYTSEGKALITYFTSKMERSTPPTRWGRDRMSLKGALVDIDWFYRSI